MSQSRRFRSTCAAALLLLSAFAAAHAQREAERRREVSGVVITADHAVVERAAVVVTSPVEVVETVTDGEGRFAVQIVGVPVAVSVTGTNIETAVRRFGPDEQTANIQLRIRYVVPPVTATVTIQNDALVPDVEMRNGAIYANGLFGRDDQLLQTLNAGINAGQHEGGGKSLEIRRYGFNLDHGGVNGGLKILIDNIQQNQGTQGHGQGYLGSLKTLSPELVEDVTLINGPFSAAYGDFSGLGVVQIRQREELPEISTARVQTGSFNSLRGFFAFSPKRRNVSSFIAYEPSYTDGPFDSPLRYRRHNLTGNLTYKFGGDAAAGLKINAGTNSFYSSGQIPLDLVASGELRRFGSMDPDSGGKASSGTAAVYYRKEWKSGAVLRADAFVGRSLLDLYSNFTFFLTDPVHGDEIQQHDSRLRQGGNVQFVQAYKLFGLPSVFTGGSNIARDQINVGLYPSVSRDPSRKFIGGNLDNPDVLLTSARVGLANYGVYVQNETSLFRGHLRLQGGLRFDFFGFDVNGFELRDVRTISRRTRANPSRNRNLPSRSRPSIFCL
ncbi:MAG: TonB-dependent receptor plug domain-containing protein [Pyrinomonadaceae bacterium]